MVQIIPRSAQDVPKKLRASLRIRDFNLHYTRTGRGHPLLLLHGLAGSSRWWVKNIPELARHFTVYTIDLAGFGRSRGQRFSLSDSAGLVLTWMDRMRIREAHVIGHSMGGYVTTMLVARSPERFNRVVLVDALALPLRSSLPAVTLRLVHAVRYMPVDFIPVLFGDTWSAGPVTMARAIRDILRADLTDELQKIQSDIMIIWGEYDTLLPLKMGQEMHRQLPGAKFVVVRRAGHNPMWDRPAAFHEAVLPFLIEGEKQSGDKTTHPLGHD